MGFRFQITEVWKARRPVVVLFGTVLEGGLQLGGKVTVPLVDGSQFEGSVMGFLRASDPNQSHLPSIQAEAEELVVGIGVERRECHEVTDIALGIVTVTSAAPQTGVL